jgi:hypothetical protein
MKKKLNYIRVVLFLTFMLLFFISSCNRYEDNNSGSGNPLDYKPFSISGLKYIGAFRLPTGTFGESSVNYAQGPIEYNAVRNSLYIVGHSHQQAIAEFSVPEIKNTGRIEDLETASPPVQIFSQILNRATDGNPQNLDRIGSLKLMTIDGKTKLLVGAYIYYDAPGTGTHSHLIIEDPDNLSNSKITGYFEMNGKPGHTSGWISPIPVPWQDYLGGTHIAGMSSGYPIIGRLSVGPTAFSFSEDDINTTGLNISSIKLLDFSLNEKERLHIDISNESLGNDIWTHLSRAVYGLVIPGTCSYLTIGNSGGHTNTVCYKCTQNDGNLCGGYCSPDTSDYYNYFWLWNIHDLLQVKNGELNAYDPRPYAYGNLDIPFHSNEHFDFGGASYDPLSNRLFVSLLKGDNLSAIEGQYDRPPLILVYKLIHD